MTVQEWKRIAYLLVNGWPGEFSKDSIVVYGDMLQEYEVEEVRGALQRCVKRGSRYRPTIGELVKEVESIAVSSQPSFDEAWELVQSAMRRPDPMGYLEGVGAHRYVVAWLATYGIERMRREPVRAEGNVHAGAVINRLRLSYEEYVERARARELHGAPPALPSGKASAALRKLSIPQLELGA